MQSKELLKYLEGVGEDQLYPFGKIRIQKEFIQIDGEHLWLDVDLDKEDICEGTNYRIEPTELGYRPFKNPEECWQEMQKHQPFGWLRMDIYNTYDYHSIDFLDDCGIISRNGHSNDFEKLFDSQTFADGTPFGIKEGGEE